MAYRISGNKLLENGKELHINGTNWLGFELKEMSPFCAWAGVSYREMIAQMKSIGVNCIRFPVDRDTLSDKPVLDGNVGWSWIPDHAPLKNATSLQVLDFVIAECERQGMHYFFDIHYHLRAPGRTWEQAPIWYFDDVTEKQWLDDQVMLAKRYKGKPGFIGIDPLNEPQIGSVKWNSGNEKDDWKWAIEKAAAAIFAVNDDIIILPQTINFSGTIDLMLNPPAKIPEDRVMYQIHFYTTDVFTGEGWAFEGMADAKYPENMGPIYDKYFGNASKKVCVLVGEWGGLFGKGPSGEKDKKGQLHFSKYLKEKKLSHAYWGFPNSSGDLTGGVQANDDFKTLWPEKVEMLKTLITPQTTFTQIGVSPVPTPNPEPSTTFKPGDIVELKSGSNPMAVVSSSGNKALCAWFQASTATVQRAELEIAILRPVQTLRSARPASPEIPEIPEDRSIVHKGQHYEKAAKIMGPEAKPKAKK